ncbi:MAG TPA: response regulator transcription factor [Acidobacteriaceae bacterium]|jgi:DNA-binding response OmpR family regulator
MHVLIVEDEDKMLMLLQAGLREHGHAVLTASNGLEGLDLACAHQFDVVLLDIMLPSMNGCDVARSLRGRNIQSAILMLTACDSEDQIISGLDAGADDYLTKPFSFRELLARIQSISRRICTHTAEYVTVGNLVLDRMKHKAYRNGRTLDLTRTELLLLDCLMSSDGKPVSRKALIETVWGDGRQIGTTTLDTFINLLRNKVDAASESKLIHTVRGFGYALYLSQANDKAV